MANDELTSFVWPWLARNASGPFDAARAGSKSRHGQLSPINAFSSNALDPSASAVSPKGADLAPLRDSYAARPRNGAGLSERAKAALSAMEDEKYRDENGASSENLLGSPETSRRSRRNSEGSITLGTYGNAKNEKERQYLEAFGVHGEAYEDYGNSRYARQAPRASMYPSENNSLSSLPATPDEKKAGLASRSAFRADRTASIWDIEATLREGRPVGASAAPPPMPVMPSQYLGASTSTSSSSLHPPAAGQPVKRSKSLINRMRSKKTPISAPQSADTSKDDISFSSPGQAPTAPTLGYQAMSSPALSEKSGYLAPDSADRPAMVPRRTTDRSNYSSSPATGSPIHSKLSPAGNPRPMRQQSADMLNVVDIKNPRRSPVNRDPPSPLGLPEPQDYFGKSGGGMSRSGRYDNLASESATAAFLAESSSKESGMSTSSSTSGNGNGNTSTADNSFATTNSTINNSSTKFDDSYFKDDSALASSGGSSGSKVSRKPSLVGRLLRGGKKKAAQ